MEGSKIVVDNSFTHREVDSNATTSQKGPFSFLIQTHNIWENVC